MLKHHAGVLRECFFRHKLSTRVFSMRVARWLRRFPLKKANHVKTDGSAKSFVTDRTFRQC